MAQALMSPSELELFEHATHLDGDRPDGTEYDEVQEGKKEKKGEWATFLLEASIFSRQVLASCQEELREQ